MASCLDAVAASFVPDASAQCKGAALPKDTKCDDLKVRRARQPAPLLCCEGQAAREQAACGKALPMQVLQYSTTVAAGAVLCRSSPATAARIPCIHLPRCCQWTGARKEGSSGERGSCPPPYSAAGRPPPLANRWAGSFTNPI